MIGNESKELVIIENNEKFTSYYFYNNFIKRVAEF